MVGYCLEVFLRRGIVYAAISHSVVIQFFP